MKEYNWGRREIEFKFKRITKIDNSGTSYLYSSVGVVEGHHYSGNNNARGDAIGSWVRQKEERTRR